MMALVKELAEKLQSCSVSEGLNKEVFTWVKSTLPSLNFWFTVKSALLSLKAESLWTSGLHVVSVFSVQQAGTLIGLIPLPTIV